MPSATSGTSSSAARTRQPPITGKARGLPLHPDAAVACFLEIRHTGPYPTPADLDHPFPSPITHTLSDLTADERHVLRSAGLLDVFDVGLATHAAAWLTRRQHAGSSSGR
ncbi:hypothetical protein [Streptomyces sp. 5-10]|uniref:hypothetical protein n=1 Tax=Streptomyces sp. 5-10 TaxID=878925 RepID=UPI00168B927A|nr:hypothetical protein [Streptomyces sp. 5-10]MBD3006492.1 hypothetical protein [Streptomyces sp. 5-10]